MRVTLTLACSDCDRRNYTTSKNKRTTPDKLSLRKFCPWCRSHTEHKETK